jgi:photosystem II stability/assembly factor-like uncharacterized protein
MKRRTLCALAMALAAAGTARAQVDLRIDDPWIYSPRAEAGRTVRATLFFRVLNAGPLGTTSGFRTRVVAGGTTVFNQTGFLGAGESGYVSQTFTVPAAGTLSFSITADVDGDVAETDETNNTATRSLDLNLPALGQWLSIGPRRIQDGANQYSGIISALAVNPQNANVIYAGGNTASGGSGTGSGLWKTSDGGTSWQPIAHNLDALQAYAVAIPPSLSNRLYLATSAGIYRSEDSGTTWRRVSTQEGGALLVVHPTDSGRLYMAVAGSLVRSTDAGSSWTPMPIAAASPGGDWANAKVTDLVRDAGGTLWAGVTHTTDGSVAGVYNSTDDGLTWARFTGCFTLPNMAGRTVRLARSGSTLYVGLRSDAYDLFRTDPGISCIIGGRPETRMARTAWSAPDPTENWGRLYADPGSENIVFVTGTRFSVSMDGGDTFTTVTGGHVDHHAFRFHPTNTSILFSGNDGGLFRSNDRGATWTFIGEGIRNVYLYDGSISPNAAAGMLGGTQDNGCLAFDGLSQSWPVFYGGDCERVAAHPTDVTVKYSLGQFPWQVRRHSSSGTTCLGCGLPGGDYDLSMMVDPRDPARLLMARGDLFRSLPGAACTVCPTATDPGSGAVWTTLSPGSGNVRRVAVDSGAGLYYAGESDGKVHFALSTSLAAWTELFAGTGAVRDIEVDPVNTSVVYVAFSGGGDGRVVRLLRTSPGAGMTATPTDITTNLPPGLSVRALAVDRLLANTVYAATQTGVWRATLTANAWTWSAYSSGMPPLTDVREVEVVPQTAVLRATTWGGGVFEAYTDRRYYSLTVARTPAGSSSLTTITSAPAGVNCGSDCSQSYPMGTVVSLAVAPPGVVDSWLGCNSSSETACSVVMSGNRSVTAHFTCDLTLCFDTCLEACLADGFLYSTCVPKCNAKCSACP